LRSGKTLPEIFQQLLGDMDLNILPERQIVRFNCDCSLERVLGALKMFGTDELKDMIEKDNGAKVTCEFCSQLYQASPKDLTQLIQDLQQPSAEVPMGQLHKSSL
ncbi:MAG: Hsp33 family molecular chaperone HslO, partial [Trichodesmium sp. St19_bin1]|nr:Hsp33 family molecular chaperone HslO [Trichodesmium sp. St19_bin1]